MNHMFYGCSLLTSIELTNFKTDNVEYMNHMFYGCKSLEKITLIDLV